MLRPLNLIAKRAGVVAESSYTSTNMQTSHKHMHGIARLGRFTLKFVHVVTAPRSKSFVGWSVCWA